MRASKPSSSTPSSRPPSVNAENSAESRAWRASISCSSRTTPSKFVLYEVYRDAAAPAKHKETAHYNAWVEKVSHMFEEPRTRALYSNVFPLDAGW